MIERIEQGWGGHYKASKHCGFVRNTVLRCSLVDLIISSVGRYYPVESKKPYCLYTDEEHPQYYETRVFKAKLSNLSDDDYQIYVPDEEVKTVPRQILDVKDLSDICANKIHEDTVDLFYNKLATELAKSTIVSGVTMPLHEQPKKKPITYKEILINSPIGWLGLTTPISNTSTSFECKELNKELLILPDTTLEQPKALAAA